MSEHVLVTGGAGYIGSILVPELLSEGYKVTVIDSFMYRQNSLAHICYNPNFSIIRGDVRVESNIKPYLKEADIVIPLAALVGSPLCDDEPSAAVSTNRDAVVSIVKNLSADQRVLIPATNSCYGNGDNDIYCDENTPMRPVSLYAQTKIDAESAVLEHENAISFRLATAFGMSPRMRIDLLVNDFTYRAINDRFVILFEGHFKRNFLHVRDIARVFIHGIKNFSKMRGQIYNVGLTEANMSKRELCERITHHVPSFVVMEAPVRKDPDQRNYMISHEKIKVTGFETKYSLDAGIAELIRGYAMIKNRRFGNN